MLLEQIADYAVKEQTSKLSADVIHHAKRAVIDWYAALLPGSRVAPATLLEQALAEDLDRGRARLANGRRATLRAAALINGAASHSVEFDDIYRDAGYHPGSPTISAALAAAQATGVSGETFLRGVVVGYEVSTRIGEAVMAASGKTPDLPADELGRLGFKLAIYPNWIILAAIPAMRAMLRELKAKGSIAEIRGKVADFKEFTEIAGLPEIQALEARYGVPEDQRAAL